MQRVNCHAAKNKLQIQRHANLIGIRSTTKALSAAWQLAPVAFIWFGKSGAEICAQLYPTGVGTRSGPLAQ